MTEGDMSALMDEATLIKRDLSNQYFVVKRLLLEIEACYKPTKARKESMVEVPKISAPTFDGDILNWV